MRIAAFNVENLFDRAKALNQDDSAVANATVKAVAELNGLFEKDRYTAANKARMLALLKQLGLLRSDQSKFVHLRKIRGALLKRPTSGAAVEVVAEGREDWIGWVEHRTEAVNEIAMMNTGRVIRDAKADVLAVIEAEDRVGLLKFTDQTLKMVNDEVDEPAEGYQGIMLIDGNDDRGIDVGLLTKPGFAIGEMHSHVHDLMPNGQPIFSRDCPEFAVTHGNRRIWVLPNHFKSKFGGDDAPSRAKRKAQATRTAELYRALRARGEDLVVVLGDLNDLPDSAPLAPLLADTDLKDISEHPTFSTGEFAGKGTYGLGRDNQKIDYLLLSPALFQRVAAGGIFRKGAWPGANPRWEVYPELKKEMHAASDHHLIWADIDF